MQSARTSARWTGTAFAIIMSTSTAANDLSCLRNGREACCRERCRDRTNTRHVGTQSNGYSEVIAIILTDKFQIVNNGFLGFPFQREILDRAVLSLKDAGGPFLFDRVKKLGIGGVVGC